MMATIIKKNVNGTEYHYISYSYRKEGKILKVEKGIGKDLPSFDDRVQLWEEFSYKIAEERWLPIIEQMASNYQKAWNKMPLPIKVKNLRAFGIRFTHHSNKIEGLTLTLREVQNVIINGKTPNNKLVEEVIETKAHMKVYEDMIQTTQDLSIDLICEWHQELFKMTKTEIAGYIRDYPVGIEGSLHEPPMTRIEIDILLEDLFQWYEDKKSIYHPVFLAAIMHYRFITIHPFGDGNGRMTRLMTNYNLHKKGYPMLDIDSKLRTKYYKALEKADSHEDNEFPFIQWFFKTYIKSNQSYLKPIH